MKCYLAPGMGKSTKYYVVWVGVEPGVYSSWEACKAQVMGYPDAKYKSFKSRAAAEAAYSGGPEAMTSGPKQPKVSKEAQSAIFRPELVQNSWSVDAACSGNPGVMEYQGVLTTTGTQLFHRRYPVGTNNIGEFLAIVHALALLQKEGNAHTSIYTDSRNALIWVKKKKAKTTLIRNVQTAELHDHIRRAEDWLQKNQFKNALLKWPTSEWGEIPADFGRK